MPMTDLDYVRGSVDSDASSNLINEVPEGNWGGGKMIYYADVKGPTTDDA